MPIVRHAPGDTAPVSGTYALVGHFGEWTDFAVLIDAGERLPVVTTTTASGPLWYVNVDVANERSGAA